MLNGETEKKSKKTIEKKKHESTRVNLLKSWPGTEDQDNSIERKVKKSQSLVPN